MARTDAEDEAPIVWPPHVKSQLIYTTLLGPKRFTEISILTPHLAIESTHAFSFPCLGFKIH